MKLPKLPRLPNQHGYSLVWEITGHTKARFARFLAIASYDLACLSVLVALDCVRDWVESDRPAVRPPAEHELAADTRKPAIDAALTEAYMQALNKRMN